MKPTPYAMLSAHGIVNRFGAQRVHDHISLDVMPGEVLGIAGEPAYTYKLTCDVSITLGVSCPKRWVYNYDDKWAAELTIIGGQVINVTNYRRP